MIEERLKLSAGFRGSVLIEEGKLYHIVNKELPFDEMQQGTLEEGLVFIDSMYAGSDMMTPTLIIAVWIAYRFQGRVTVPVFHKRLLSYGMPYQDAELIARAMCATHTELKEGICLTPVGWEETPLYLGYPEYASELLPLIISEGGVTDAVHAFIRSALFA